MNIDFLIYFKQLNFYYVFNYYVDICFISFNMKKMQFFYFNNFKGLIFFDDIIFIF